jgi:hypothetical protein
MNARRAIDIFPVISCYINIQELKKAKESFPVHLVRIGSQMSTTHEVINLYKSEEGSHLKEIQLRREGSERTLHSIILQIG